MPTISPLIDLVFRLIWLSFAKWQETPQEYPGYDLHFQYTILTTHRGPTSFSDYFSPASDQYKTPKLFKNLSTATVQICYKNFTRKYKNDLFVSSNISSKIRHETCTVFFPVLVFFRFVFFSTMVLYLAPKIISLAGFVILIYLIKIRQGKTP